MRKLILLIPVCFLSATLSYAQRTYSTLFPLTENPISEGGNWTNSSGDWGAVRTTAGQAYGVSLPTQYGDPTAIVSGSWGATQTAQGVVHVGTVPTSGEVELRLRTTLSTGVNSGYEFLCPTQNSPGYGYQIVRWNGTAGQFVYINSATSPHQCIDGDVLTATASGTNPVVMNFYNNGTLVATACDNGNASGWSGTCNGISYTYSGPGGAAGPFTSGNPGIGFYDGNNVDWAKFGFSYFIATDSNQVALTCSTANVSTAVTAATDGTSVYIPPGTCTWSSGVTATSKGISIIGAGSPTSDPTTVGPSSTCTTTTITETGGTTFTFNPTYGNSTTRLSCIQLTYSSGAVVGFKVQGTCTSSGCPNFRMDNVKFTSWAGHSTAPSNSYGIGAVSNAFGVIDHNSITGGGSTYLQLLELGLPVYKGVGAYGDNDWAQPESFGSTDFLFIENNAFTTAGISDNETTVVTNGGGRIVARFNTFASMDNLNFTLGWHGTESNGRPRSVHAYEYYANSYTCPAGGTCGTVVGARNGTGILWGNSITKGSGASLNNFLESALYRAEGNPTSVWGPCDGSVAYDTNDGTTYWSGTIGSFTGSGPYTITVSGTSPGWTTNQWTQAGAPYSVHDVTKTSGAEITGNGANTLTVKVSGGPGAYSPSNGDTIQILRATSCIDQMGRGYGQYYTGSPASPASAANQTIVPTFVFTNTFTGGSPGFGDQGVNSGSARMIKNREYYRENINQTAQTSASSPFDGSTTIGMGHGTIARRPTTCTTGVGYWATDEGSWNTSGSGPQGRLYLCTATNTWTLSYTPYTYPHPLAGGTAPPTAPAVTLSPGSLNFGTQQIGATSSSLPVQLTNSGDATLNISSITISGDFAIFTNTCGATLDTSASCTVSPNFTPTVSGARTGTLTFNTDASTSPDTVSLSGTGAALRWASGLTITGVKTQ